MLTDKHLELIKSDLRVIMDHIPFSAIKINTKKFIKALFKYKENIYCNGNIIKQTTDFSKTKI